MLFLSCGKDETVDEAASIVYVNSITIEGRNITEGLYSQMKASVLPINAANKSVLWEVSDKSVAEISTGGLLKANKNGTIIVTATAKDKGTVKTTKEITVSSFETGIGAGSSREVSNATELIEALAIIEAGGTIVLKQGTYTLATKISISKSGTSQNKITLIGKAGEGRPKLDFSSMSENSSNQGILLNADYWYIKGIDIYKAGDNGMQIKGNNNLIEFCAFSECADTGLQLDDGATNNTILNCDSFFNADSSIENADGFACKLSAGTGNKFIACRAWQNLDDGWDGYLRGADNIATTYENCWAIKNGYLKNGTQGNGDGNGFKTGGSDDKLLKHHAIYKNCVAVGNVHDGFDHNSNRGNVEIYNCSAYDNGKNYSFSSTNSLEKLTIKNSNALGTYGSSNASTFDITNNSWQNGITTTEDDFESINYNQLISSRKSDGSLPNVTFFHLKSGSDLIDKGVDVGLPFNGNAPDLGAFESDETGSKYDIVVDANGSGNFITVQEALNTIATNKQDETIIYIKNGTYKEKVIIESNKINITLIGEDKENTILTYDDYASKLDESGSEIGTFGSYSFAVEGANFKAENITFSNTAGNVGQAVAVRVKGDKAIFNNCKFLGFQDTLYAHTENVRQYFKNCYIEGATDFIFGSSLAVFDTCEIFSKVGGQYLTAAKTPEGNSYGFVFLNCKLTSDAPNNSVYLGRPWGNYAQTVFVNCELGAHIKAEGWHNWGKTEAESTTFYAEYNCTGTGANRDNRVPWSYGLTQQEYNEKYSNLQTILNNWIPNIN